MQEKKGREKVEEERSSREREADQWQEERERKAQVGGHRENRAKQGRDEDRMLYQRRRRLKRDKDGQSGKERDEGGEKRGIER